MAGWRAPQLRLVRTRLPVCTVPFDFDFTPLFLTPLQMNLWSVHWMPNCVAERGNRNCCLHRHLSRLTIPGRWVGTTLHSGIAVDEPELGKTYKTRLHSLKSYITNGPGNREWNLARYDGEWLMCGNAAVCNWLPIMGARGTCSNDKPPFVPTAVQAV